ncbi:unnamed protein product [Caenorhabditis sp. 36 PRJEB53466]|nr:unnamed protein product [Caenorhabditis sp. 36 PRJEB53466]
MSSGFLSSPESLTTVFNVITWIDLPMHVLGIYCILAKTPDKMKNVKVSMLTLHILSSLMVFSMTFLLIPYVLFPYFAGKPLGFLAKIGVPIAVQVYLGVTMIALTAVGILSVFENRYFRLFNHSNWKSLRKYYLTANYTLALTFFVYPFTTIPDQEYGRNEIFKSVPRPVLEGIDPKTIFVFSLNPVPSVALIFFAVVLYVSQIIVLFVIILHNLITKYRHSSQKTYEIQKKFMIALFVQFIVTLLIFATPIFFVVYSIVWSVYNQSLNNICFVILSLYGLISTLTMIYLQQPYREWILGVFTKSTRKLALNNFSCLRPPYCRACRLEQCLKVGMKLNLSNILEIRNEKDDAIVALIGNLLHLDNKRERDLITTFTYDNPSLEDVVENRKLTIRSRDPSYKMTSEDWCFFGAYTAVKFLLSLGFMKKMDSQDKLILLENFVAKATLLFSALRTMRAKNDKMIKPDGNDFFHEFFSRWSHFSLHFTNRVRSLLVNRLIELHITNEEFILITVVFFCNPALENLSEYAKNILGANQKDYSSALMQYCMLTYQQNGPSRFTDLVALCTVTNKYFEDVKYLYWLFEFQFNVKYKKLVSGVI